MDNLDSWRVFETTGKVEDYLKYAKEKRVNEARESFIFKIEGDRNDRENDCGGHGDFRNAYK